VRTNTLCVAHYIACAAHYTARVAHYIARVAHYIARVAHYIRPADQLSQRDGNILTGLNVYSCGGQRVR